MAGSALGQQPDGPAPAAKPDPKPPEIVWRIIVPDRPRFTEAITPGEAAWLPPG